MHRTYRTISRQENITYIVLLPTGWHLIPFPSPPPPPPQRVYGRTEYAYVTAKISRMDSLPNFLSYGATLARARLNSK